MAKKKITELIEEISEEFLRENRREPVSYTHLDVYKRQRLHKAVNCHHERSDFHS